ncbi:hypothetical protein HYC85_017855 [Camellia sinensis]|uniref:Uncharacterized protein n=1 Tax=Camellia sinensis TaxID=4442 RepID=A0A7J7GWI9_CAMSI|nr:hypothetical protein HYC85_017855 [Camellia sinensis]
MQDVHIDNLIKIAVQKCIVNIHLMNGPIARISHHDETVDSDYLEQNGLESRPKHVGLWKQRGHSEQDLLRRRPAAAPPRIRRQPEHLLLLLRHRHRHRGCCDHHCLRYHLHRCPLFTPPPPPPPPPPIFTDLQMSLNQNCYKFVVLQKIKNPNYKGKWKTPWIDNPEIRKMQQNARGQFERIFKEHEKITMQLAAQSKELEQREKELEKREARNENEKKQLYSEKEMAVGLTSAFVNVLAGAENKRATLKQKKADENILRLAEDQQERKSNDELQDARKELINPKMFKARKPFEVVLNAKLEVHSYIFGIEEYLDELKHFFVVRIGYILADALYCLLAPPRKQSWKGNAERHFPGWDDGFNFHGTADMHLISHSCNGSAGVSSSGRKGWASGSSWPLPIEGFDGRTRTMGAYSDARTASCTY